ncbi:MAG: hypothetical protein QXI36_03485 [Candidatus Bathyarchaeia archaeon]
MMLRGQSVSNYVHLPLDTSSIFVLVLLSTQVNDDEKPLNKVSRLASATIFIRDGLIRH